MDKIKILDKSFDILIDEKSINSRIIELARDISADFSEKDPVFVGILNGCFMFTSDLLKELNINCKITFLKLASYQGTQSTGKVKELIGINEEIKNKPVIIVEDIIDTGITINHIVEELRKYEPSEIKIASLVYKKEAYKGDYTIDYYGFEIPNKFIVGYGLDYDGYGRNLRHIYQVTN